MTLPALLKRYGIRSQHEFAERMGLSRQQAWNLWRGYRGVGRQTMQRLHERLGIPYEELAQIDPPRPRQRPPEPPQEE